MKQKIVFLSKLFFSLFFSLLWLILVQAEYEMLTKPELQSEFPLVQGKWAVYLLGFILVIIGLLIIFLIYSIIKVFKNHKYTS